MAEPFFDTNILIYAFARADARQQPARDLLAIGGVFSVQVANEFVDVARRKLGWSWREAAAALDDLRIFLGVPVALTDEIHREALNVSLRYGYRIYDSLLVSAARASGCRTLYTEDLQHGQSLEGITIHNPFLPA